MRKVIGGILGAVSGAAMGWGIVTVVLEAFACTSSIAAASACAPDLTTTLPAIIGGSVGMIISVILWWGAWITAPLAGLATAGALWLADGRDVDPGTAAFIGGTTLLGPAILVAIAIWARGRRKQAENLVATGSRAVATVQGVESTGVLVNHQPQVRIAYLLQPLDGTPPFQASKRQVIAFGTTQPRPGLRWPAWYDPADPQKFAVGAPGGSFDEQTRQLLAEFGIQPAQAYGFDPTGGVAPSTGAPPAAGQAGGSPLGQGSPGVVTLPEAATSSQTAGPAPSGGDGTPTAGGWGSGGWGR